MVKNRLYIIRKAKNCRKKTIELHALREASASDPRFAILKLKILKSNAINFENRAKFLKARN